MSTDIPLFPGVNSDSSTSTSGTSGTSSTTPTVVSTSSETAITQDSIASAGTEKKAADSKKGGSSATPVLTPPNSENLSSSAIIGLIAGSLNTYRRLNARGQQQSQNTLTLGTVTRTVTQQTGSKGGGGGSAPPPPPTVEEVQVPGLSTTLESTLGTSINETAKQRLKKSLQPFTLNLIHQYVRETLNTTTIKVVVATLSMLQDPLKPSHFMTNEKQAALAVRIAHAEQLSSSIGNEDIKNLANQIFPKDAAAAKAFTQDTQRLLLETSLDGAGKALGLPGFKNQVLNQASLVRSTQQVLTNPNQVKTISSNLSKQFSTTGVNSQTEISQAIEDAFSNGTFSSRNEVQIALKQAFRKQFPELSESDTNTLARSAEKNALDIALSQTNASTNKFNADAINTQNTQESIKNAILKEFSDSDQAIRASAASEAISKQVFSQGLNSQYQNAEQVRSAIKNALQSQFDDLSNIQAQRIVSQVDLGLSKSSPLYTGQGTLSPNEFKDQLHEIVTSQANLPIFSELHQFVDRVAGIQDHYNGTNTIALLNESYRAEDENHSSYLNLDAQAAIDEHQKQRLDPAGELILSWANMMNGIPQPDKHQKTIFGPM